ncbi:Sec-independent protein translocase subunit TatA [Pseudonocardia endophytica]|uniref:Sec-independent protein translocase protein TatA n=1 Tax=Pseudonocardia endophytica TaxID=401976 RepID=A0A4R1HZN2_PSEEN|nr:Sec-independent protein translocase subunit TatA [Pseudonocardia endophytica]TCK23072.1 sec-independent protein translocase protein TatA [Pseudonocardia endophytica]
MPGGYEWLIIIGVLLLLFGAKKLPDMARSVGQSARVFKGEMKGLKDDAKTADPREDLKPDAPQQVNQAAPATTPEPTPPAQPAAQPAEQPAERPEGEPPAPAQHDRTDAR